MGSMRASVILTVACACSFEPQKSGLGPGEQLVTLVEDTEVELASSETLSEGIVTPGGTIEPHAFVLDGLRARAYQTAIPLDEGITTFADVETALAAAPQTARRTAYGQLPVNWGGERPRGLGLTSDETFTIIFDGELALIAGDNLVEIDADDAAILELDSGSGLTNTVVDSTSGRKAMTVNVLADGWYPVRAAIKETSGNARLELFLEGALVTPQQLRAKVTNDQGLIVKVFDSAHTPPRGTTAAAVVDSVFGTAPPPYDLADVTTTYDLRFVGQI
jgi:hypothetical protein